MSSCKELTQKDRSLDYITYHELSRMAGDIDPSYDMLRYVCDRFELNIEQRYWLAFLYATCYSGPTVYFMYNEFPDYENIHFGRLEHWWKANKERALFQTDRRWVRSRNQWVDMIRSYRKTLGGLTQRQWFELRKTSDPYTTYENVWSGAEELYCMGRFALFLYLEAVHVVTGFPMLPRTMDISEAESCRNGLAEAIGRPDLNNHGEDRRIPIRTMTYLQKEFDGLVKHLRARDSRNNVWNIETTLCAYKKYRLGKRYVGFYLDRQHEEISRMSATVREGVDWSVLWDYRDETYQTHFLKEKTPCSK